MELGIFLLLLLPCFTSVKAFATRSVYVDTKETRDGARTHCQISYQQGDLAPWENIENTQAETSQVWDGNSYRLSPVITIIGCTNDVGITQHTVPDLSHWSDRAGQCQVLCDTTFFAIRETSCHCLDGSYTPIDDMDCVSMLMKTPSVSFGNMDAKAVFQTVSPEITSGDSDQRCVGTAETNTPVLRECGDKLNMECKTGSTSAKSWKEAGYECADTHQSFLQPVPDGTATVSTWLGGFRTLQYVSGSTDGTFCKRLTYEGGGEDVHRFKEVDCDGSYEYYCVYIESGFNETCDVTLTSSCTTPFICSDRINGTQRCLCSEANDYWDEETYSCTTRKKYGETCDVSITEICEVTMSCQYNGEGHFCDCNEQLYWDFAANSCQPVIAYGGTCQNSAQCVKYAGVDCVSTNEQRACHCVTETYWNESSLTCVIQHSYKQTCPPQITNSCKGNLICTNDSLCECLATKYWNETTGCVDRYTYGSICPPGPEDSCLGDRICKAFRGEYRCLCDQNTIYDGATCQQGFSVIATNISEASEPMGICLGTATYKRYLEDDYNFEEFFKDCDGNTVGFQSWDTIVGAVVPQCIFMRMLNGTIQRNASSNCSDTLPVVCVIKALSSTSNLCRITGTSNIPTTEGLPGTEDQDGDNNNNSNSSDDPTTWIILAIAGALLISIVVVIVIFIKRKRGEHEKVQEVVSIPLEHGHQYDTIRSDYDHKEHKPIEKKDDEYGVLGQKPNVSTDSDMYSHTRHQKEGHYDTFSKPTNDVSDMYDHTHNIRQREGGEYGELGKLKPEVANDDMYSHTKHSKPEGEYDSFTNTAVNKDAGDIYDRTHNVLMENAYDEFTNGKK